VREEKSIGEQKRWKMNKEWETICEGCSGQRNITFRLTEILFFYCKNCIFQWIKEVSRRRLAPILMPPVKIKQWTKLILCRFTSPLKVGINYYMCIFLSERDIDTYQYKSVSVKVLEDILKQFLFFFTLGNISMMHLQIVCNSMDQIYKKWYRSL
jgi:hypothetical protein